MLKNTSLHAKSSAFKLDLIDFPKLERIDGATRLYEAPDGSRYPSVTTVLSAMKDKTHLDLWRKRVGAAEADRVLRFSSKRGTAIHQYCEDYVGGKEVTIEMPGDKLVFKQIQKVLDKHVNNVRALESPMFSHKLRIAGTCDLIAEYDGRLAIIDYKTSAGTKEKEWITDYFYQASLYSFMLWEMTGLQAPDIVVIIGGDDVLEAQVFREKAPRYIREASELVKAYHAR